MIPAFSKIQSPDDTINRIQQNIARAVNPIVQLPQTQVLLLTKVILVSGTNFIPHKLGRNLQGWRIVRLRSAATFYDQQDQNLSPAITLALVASANCTVDIEVY